MLALVGWLTRVLFLALLVRQLLPKLSLVQQELALKPIRAQLLAVLQVQAQEPVRVHVPGRGQGPERVLGPVQAREPPLVQALVRVLDLQPLPKLVLVLPPLPLLLRPVMVVALRRMLEVMALRPQQEVAALLQRLAVAPTPTLEAAGDALQQRGWRVQTPLGELSSLQGNKLWCTYATVYCSAHHGTCSTLCIFLACSKFCIFITCSTILYRTVPKPPAYGTILPTSSIPTTPPWYHTHRALHGALTPVEFELKDTPVPLITS